MDTRVSGWNRSIFFDIASWHGKSGKSYQTCNGESDQPAHFGFRADLAFVDSAVAGQGISGKYYLSVEAIFSKCVLLVHQINDRFINSSSSSHLICRVQSSASAGSTLLRSSCGLDSTEAALSSTTPVAAAALSLSGGMTKKRSSLMYENWSTVRMCASDFRTHDT